MRKQRKRTPIKLTTDLVNWQKRVGAHVSKLRKAKGWSTTRMARLVGVSQAQISRVETGKQGLRSAMLFRFAKIFGTTPASILAAAENARLVKGRK